MKGEKMHEIVSLGKRTVSEKSDIQMTSGRFPLPVSKLSLNGSGRTLFIEARWWYYIERAMNSIVGLSRSQQLLKELFTDAWRKIIHTWGGKTSPNNFTWPSETSQSRVTPANGKGDILWPIKGQAQPLSLSFYSCSLMGTSQEDRGPDWVRKSYHWSFFFFISPSQSLLQVWGA